MILVYVLLTSHTEWRADRITFPHSVNVFTSRRIGLISMKDNDYFLQSIKFLIKGSSKERESRLSALHWGSSARCMHISAEETSSLLLPHFVRNMILCKKHNYRSPKWPPFILTWKRLSNAGKLCDQSAIRYVRLGGRNLIWRSFVFDNCQFFIRSSTKFLNATGSGSKIR